MPCIYVLRMKCKGDGVMYYKVGYLSEGDAPSRMGYRDGSNVPLTTYFELLGYYQQDTVYAKQIESRLHNKIRNEWRWKCDGSLGIHRKHKYFPLLFSGVTECRVYDKEEVKMIIKYIQSELEHDPN